MLTTFGQFKVNVASIPECFVLKTETLSLLLLFLLGGFTYFIIRRHTCETKTTRFNEM